MSAKHTQHVQWDDDSASDYGTELNASSKRDSPATKSKGVSPRAPVTNFMRSQSLSFDNNTHSGYQAEKESDTEDVPRKFPAVDSFLSIPNILSRIEKGKENDPSASQWFKQSSMTTGESDVESVESINSSLSDAKQEVLYDKATVLPSVKDEEFLDLSSEKDLQTRTEWFLEQVKSIQVILDQAQVSDNPAINQEVRRRIQVHALEIAGIFGDNVRDLNKLTEKLGSEISDLKSINLSQKQQRDKLAADLARAHGTIIELDRSASSLRQQIYEARDKTTNVEYELVKAKKEHYEAIKLVMEVIDEAELAANTANQAQKDDHQLEVSQLKAQIENLQRVHNFEQEKNQRELLDKSKKRIAVENELKEQNLRLEQMDLFYDALKGEYRTLQRTVQEGHSRYKDLVARYSEKGQELAEAQMKVGTLHDYIHGLKELQKLEMEKVQQHMRQLCKEKNYQLMGLRAELNDTKSMVQRQRSGLAEITELKYDLHTTKQQVLAGQRMHEREKKLMARNHVALTASLSEKIMRLEVLQAPLQSEIQKVCTNNKSLRAENEDLFKQVQLLKATDVAAQSELETYKFGNRPGNKRIAAILAENEKLKAQVHGLEREAITETKASGQLLSS